MDGISRKDCKSQQIFLDSGKSDHSMALEIQTPATAVSRPAKKNWLKLNWQNSNKNSSPRVWACIPLIIHRTGGWTHEKPAKKDLGTHN